MLFDDLFEEAERQLNVCNSCRYCAGYCPVWPALELRTNLTDGDITHLANLCHDCRDCFTACMYTAPHEFNLNPPQIFTSVREHTYEHYTWPRRFPQLLQSRWGLLLGFILSAMALLGLAIWTKGTEVFVRHQGGDPYEVIAHWPLVSVFTLASVWSGVVIVAALVKYWRDTHGQLRDVFKGRPWLSTFQQAAVLRHQSGGDEGCSYESEAPSGRRRYAHQLVMYGFLLTFVSTSSAAFMENVLGIAPPFDYISAPVISGTLGGVLASVGCWWLLSLKRRSDLSQTTESMRTADVNLVRGLLVLMVTGIAVLLLRDTAAFGVVFLVHIASVLLAMVIAPYTKFFHFTYRLLAIYKDNLERTS